MKTAIILSLFVATSAFAGPVEDYSKDKNPVIPPPPPPVCFGPGFDIGIFGGGYLPGHEHYHNDRGIGGGGLVEYFFNDWLGIQAAYGAFGPEPVKHDIGGNLVLRYPFQSLCLAPYLLIGGGGIVNSTKFGYFDVGAGVEWRCTPHVGVFADGAYHFAKANEGFTEVRLGVKYAF